MSGASEPQPRLVLENFIGGKFVACKSHIDSYNPSTGEVYCSVPDSGAEEVGHECSHECFAELNRPAFKSRFCPARTQYAGSWI